MCESGSLRNPEKHHLKKMNNVFLTNIINLLKIGISDQY